MKVARAYLWFGVVASVLGGLAYLFAPAAVTQAMGIEHATPAGLTDLRATYAGFQLGMALLLWWCLQDASRHAAGLVAFACVVGGLAVTRSLGLLLDGFAPGMAFAAGLEIALTAFAIFALSRLRREASAVA